MKNLPKGLLAAGAVSIALLALLIRFDARQRAELRRNAAVETDSWQSRGMYFPVAAATGVTAEQQELIDAVGYSAAYERAPDASGVVRHDGQRAQDGLNLVLSAHAPAAELMDMEGRVRHRWSRAFQDVFGEPRVPEDGRLTFGESLRAQPGIDGALVAKLPRRFLGTANPGQKYFRRAYPYPNGDLLVIYSYLGAVKLDRESNPIWSQRTMAHHAADIGADGRVFLISAEPRALEGFGEDGHVLSDTVLTVGAGGAIEKMIDILDCFLNSRYATLVTRTPQAFDLLHTNAVTVLDGGIADRIPAFKAGNLLVSCRNIDTIAVIDPEARAVVWAMKGPWVMQHEPVMLESGRVLLFDNSGNGGYSRVTEFDPVTQAIAWEFAGMPPESFYSIGLGTAQRLANGNTLITESTRGRAFEVTPGKEIVWEYMNPARVREGGQELIGALFDVVRLPSDYGASWLGAPAAE